MTTNDKEADHMTTEPSGCRHCGRPITLVQTGKDSAKWVTGEKRSNWRCDADPERPILSHEPEPS